MEATITGTTLEMLKKELSQLDECSIDIDGKNLRAGSCYYIGYNPLHVLYNTNCPESLKEKIESIISKYITADESSSH
ncbi:MAG: hypothetical protein QM791_07765 [Ferruginibacter sp.]